MDNEPHEQGNRKQQSKENPLNGILLDKNLEVSDDPHPIQAVIQKNEDCLEVMNGLTERGNIMSISGGGGGMIFWVFLLIAPFGTMLQILSVMVPLLLMFVIIPLTFSRVLASNFRINRKTNKLYAIDNKTSEPISCDLDKVTIHKFQNFRMSARGLSRDFNLAFSGKDETTGKTFSFPTPALSDEEHSIDNWEYFRRFLKGTPVSDMPDINKDNQLLGSSFSHQIKLRIEFWLLNSGLRPLKEHLIFIGSNIVKFNLKKVLISLSTLIFPILGTIMSILILPGDIFETFVYFYWKKHPKFAKENDELCGFSETNTA